MINQNGLLLAFYGDDFTGSTDALEFLSRAGAKTVLFIQPPGAEQLKRYSGLQAIGVAGLTRSLGPDDMEKELRPAFQALQQLGARHVHYKVCSTFDSSPTIGSIGKAIDIGAEIFSSEFIPLLVAAPALGRYCAFGNLFAQMGIGSKGTIYRLDRHPSMSRHPVTPADESDLRLHLARQTSKKIGLMDILQITLPEAEAKKALSGIIQTGAGVVLFDAVYQDQMAGIGLIIDSFAGKQKPLFSVGSSGVEMALGAYWTNEGTLQPPQSWTDPGKASPLLVASGSCSPVTSAQIAWAVAQGFAEVPLNIEVIEGKYGPELVIGCDTEDTITPLKEGRSVIIHTCRGADDERIDKTAAIFSRMGIDRSETSQWYGSALGRMVRKAASQVPLKRLVIAGGDTSGFTARELGIEAVEMIAPISPGAPLCKAYAPGSPVDGWEVNFKGGQVGREDYFGMVLEGKILS
jgi:uncharacterized protein YgbK (DUF1537 family)